MVTSVNPKILVELAILSGEDLAGTACYTPSTVGSRSHEPTTTAVRAQCLDKTLFFAHNFKFLCCNPIPSSHFNCIYIYICICVSMFSIFQAPQRHRSKTPEAKRHNRISHICRPFARLGKVTLLFAKCWPKTWYLTQY